MANTTFANLKIKALRKAGNNYSAADATRLEIAGGIINDVMGMIQTLIKGHPFTLDIGNTVATVASQAYVNLVDTDIIEVLNVYQRVSDRTLKQITYTEYIEAISDPTRLAGVPDLAWAPTQVITNGVPVWTLYFIPTPSAIQTMYYDYVKNLQFSVDGTAADPEFCKLPPVYDAWIYAEFKPLFYEIIDPKNRALIRAAEQARNEARAFYREAIMSQATRTGQAGSARDARDYRYQRVATTPAP